MTIFIILITAVISIFIYKMSTQPSNEKLLKEAEVKEKSKKEDNEFEKAKLYFNQFNGYFDDLFTGDKRISRKDLEQMLSNDFRGYRNGDSDELITDLLATGLISFDFKTNLFHKGSAFDNLRFTFPNSIKFLEERGNTLDYSLDNNIRSQHTIHSASISKRISNSNLIYFTFGVANQHNIPRWLLGIIDADSNDEYLFLYTTIAKTARKGRIGQILAEAENEARKPTPSLNDYLAIQKDLPIEQYQKILENWLSRATKIVNTYESEP